MNEKAIHMLGADTRPICGTRTKQGYAVVAEQVTCRRCLRKLGRVPAGTDQRVHYRLNDGGVACHATGHVLSTFDLAGVTCPVCRSSVRAPA